MIKSLRGFLPIAVCSLFAVGVQAQDTPQDSGTDDTEDLQRDTHLRITRASGGQLQLLDMWINAGRYRLETNGDDKKGVEIFRDDTVYLLNFDERNYTSVNHERLVAAAEQTRQLFSNVQRPTVQRELRKTGGVGLIAKYPCQGWEVYKDGVLTTEMCVVPFTALSTQRAVLETVERYNAIFKDTDADDASLPWSDAETMEGLPLMVRNYIDGKMHAETVVVELAAGTLPIASHYVLPPDMEEIKEEQP